MAFECALCGKSKIYGEQHTHKPGVAGGQWKKRAPRTRKVSLPNLQPFRGYLGGVKGHWHFCIRCLRIVKAEQKTFLEQQAKKKAAVEVKKAEPKKVATKEVVEKKTATKKVTKKTKE